MRTHIGDHVGTFEWTTDDWDSVDWSTFWDRQRLGAHSRLASVQSSIAPLSSRQWRIRTPDDLWRRESIADTLERLTTPIFDNSIPWAPDRFAPTPDGPPSEDAMPGLREVWCQPGNHYWLRPVIAGRAPLACPEHDHPLDSGHASEDPSCFRFGTAWALRLEVVASLRWSNDVEMPDALAGAIGLAPQQIREVHSAVGRGPLLRLWRGRHGASVRGRIDELIPADVGAGDRLFIAFDGSRYAVHHTSPDRQSAPRARLAALTGLELSLAEHPDFWSAVARRFGVSDRSPRQLVEVAHIRGDTELAAAIEAAIRQGLHSAAWADGWDLTAPLHSDDRFYAVADGGRLRVALGVADVRDQLPDAFLVTPGGLVWVEVDEPDDARVFRMSLDPDVVTPALSERWVDWMRLEHAARRASLAGESWLLVADGADGWRLGDGRRMRDLADAFGDFGEDRRVNARMGLHQRHYVPRSVLAIDRAIRRARDGMLKSIGSDAAFGFAATWPNGSVRASTVLGTLTVA